MRLIMKLREVLANHFEPAFQNDEDQDIEYSNFCFYFDFGGRI
jgi:hypothetical protein